jgi:hypothetical protein
VDPLTGGTYWEVFSSLLGVLLKRIGEPWSFPLPFWLPSHKVSGFALLWAPTTEAIYQGLKPPNCELKSAFSLYKLIISSVPL